MENVINTLYIQNFKSIRNAVIHPRRVNLIIGQPNVGKSTLLEAMSLLGSFPYERKKKFLRSFVRYERPAQLFHDSLMTAPIRVETDQNVCLLGSTEGNKRFQYAVFSLAAYRLLRVQLELPLPESRAKAQSGDDGQLLARLYSSLATAGPLPEPGYIYTEMDHNGVMDLPGGNGHYLALSPAWQPRAVKAYCFKPGVRLNYRYSDVGLRPPHGNNLVQVLENHADLRQKFVAFFANHGLLLQMRPDAGRMDVIKNVDGLSYTYPYSSSGDILQRYAFYLAAIESNHKTVIMLKEPETHLSATYRGQLAELIATKQTNQFFVTTHSPAFFNEVLENMVPYENRVPELAVFVVHYKDFQTKIRQLSDEEVRGLRRDSLDVFESLSEIGTAPMTCKV